MITVGNRVGECIMCVIGTHNVTLIKLELKLIEYVISILKWSLNCSMINVIMSCLVRAHSEIVSVQSEKSL